MIKHICDICKKEIDENSFKMMVPVWHEYVATNGKGAILGKMVSKIEEIEEKEIEICDSCTKHLANILYDNFDIHN